MKKKWAILCVPFRESYALEHGLKNAGIPMIATVRATKTECISSFMTGKPPGKWEDLEGYQCAEIRVSEDGQNIVAERAGE